MITTTATKIHADHTAVKRLGNWTTARTFEVRARRASTVLDLRSPQIEAGDIEVRVDLDHSMLKLLVPEDAVIDQTELSWTGRGRVKDMVDPRQSRDGRVIRLIGHITKGEVRINRGGVAVLSAMFSREYVEDVLRAHREDGMPTVDDPARVG